MSPPPFVLNCLGTPRLLTVGGQEVRIKVKKHLAVLVILAVDGGKVRRERLVSMLWPTARPDRARGSVATAISVLRGKLGGDAIEPARDWVQLRRGCVSMDLERLSAGLVVGDDFTPPLEVDSFLAGFEMGLTPEFEDWKERQHARLLPAVEKALITLANHARRSGDLGKLADTAEKLLSLNDLSESGIQARMEAYALSGDRITALRIHEEWTSRLRAELNARPSTSLEELASRLRRHGVPSTASDVAPTPVQTEQWRNQHFVGRAREYRCLTSTWERAEQSKHILVCGDSGVGKTTLVDRFATAIALQGSSVARTRCFELERSIPYAMIGSIVEALLSSPGSAATSPRALSELGCLVPTVRQHFPGLPVLPEAAGESARLRFAEATVEFLHTLSEERPILITIDDINLSDEASIAVLHMILRRIQKSRIMFVLTWRNIVSHQRDEFSRLRDCREEIGLDVLTLEPLNEEYTEGLFDALASELGAVASLSQRRDLIRCASGLPLALELLMRDWLANGKRSLALSINAITTDVESCPDTTYKRLSEKLIGDLTTSERLLASLAAILDRRLGDLAMYEAAGATKAVALQTLSTLLDRRVIRDTASGLEWVNPTVRAHAYVMISPSIRTLLHSVVLSELQRRAAFGHEVPGLELAWHCFRAGRRKEGSSYLTAGAAEALRAGAPIEAERALVSAMPQVEPAERPRAAILLAESLQEQARFQDSIPYLDSISGAGKELLERAAVLRIRAIVSGSGPQAPDSDWLNELEQLASIAGESSTRVLAISTAASAATWGVSATIRERFIDACKRFPQAELRPEDLLRLWTAHAKFLYIGRDSQEAVDLLERAVQASDSLNIRSSVYCSALNGLGVIAASVGSYGRSLEYAEKLYAESIRRGADEPAYFAGGNVAANLIRLGRYEEAFGWLERIEKHNHLLSPGLEANILGYVAEAAALTGRDSIARRTITMLESIAKESPYGSIIRLAAFGAADALYLVGDVERAVELAQLGLATLEQMQDFDSAGWSAKWGYLSAMHSGDPEKAREMLEALLPLPLDAIDRAYTLACLAQLNGEYSLEQEQLQAALAVMPCGVADNLMRYGLVTRSQRRLISAPQCPIGDVAEDSVLTV